MSGSGFISRGGFFGIGQVTVTHGLGGFGMTPYEPEAPPVTDSTLTGVRAPRAVVESKRAPKSVIYVPGAKKK